MIEVITHPMIVSGLTGGLILVGTMFFAMNQERKKKSKKSGK